MRLLAWPLKRREFLSRAVAAGLALSPAGPLLAAACGKDRGTRGDAANQRPAGFDARYAEAARRAEATGPPARQVRLVAEPGEVEIGPGQTYRTWLYNGTFPGPEIRVAEGERLRVVLENRLPEATTIHWHGVPVPNAMDGVPGVTQPAVPPGGSFVYDYVTSPAGSYMYHSHVGLQLDRGLLGSLVIEEREPHIPYDREYTLMLDDWLPTEPEPASARAESGMGGMMERMRGMMGGQEGGMMGDRVMQGRGGGMMLVDPARPNYADLLVNGRPPSDPPTFEVRHGQRVRFRLVNPASATLFRVAVAGHRMTVTHTDGRPVEPVTVDALLIGMGERYDVVIEADNPGVWTIAAESLLGTPAPGRAVLRYVDAARRAAAPGETPTGPGGGRMLRLADLVSTEISLSGDERADRHFDLALSWGMMMAPDEWTIDGRRYPDAPPLEIGEGEHVQVTMVNHSPIHHPMHLHGHFFRVGGALKETVLVPGHMGRISFAFTADNPGDWFFHCHNLYHMESGMARVFRYV
ncbi:MAG: multicopper oxidase family protein [Gemmatimonadota bacterium]